MPPVVLPAVVSPVSPTVVKGAVAGMISDGAAVEEVSFDGGISVVLSPSLSPTCRCLPLSVTMTQSVLFRQSKDRTASSRTG